MWTWKELAYYDYDLQRSRLVADAGLGLALDWERGWCAAGGWDGLRRCCFWRRRADASAAKIARTWKELACDGYDLQKIRLVAVAVLGLALGRG